MSRTSIHLIALGALLFVHCDEEALLPPGDQTSVDYWADYFLDKFEEERTAPITEPSPGFIAERRTVLLITGVSIRAEWFDSIAARLQRDGFDTVVYEPPELLTYDLFDATEDLAAVIERVVEESGQERIDILAECTGGLIARHYIQSMGGDEYVARMVTFVSPQNGVAKAPLAALIAGWPALYDLSPGSDFLRAVNDAPLPENVAFTSIYSCTDEYIQPWETSIIPGATNIGLCDGFVGHFQTLYDPAIYELMYQQLIAETATEPAVLLARDLPEDAGPEPETPVEEPARETPAPPEEPAPHPEEPAVLGGAPMSEDEPASPTSLAEAPFDPATPDDDDVAGCSSVGRGARPGAPALWLLPLAALFALRARRRHARGRTEG